MTLADRLQQIAAALPSDSSSVTLTRADLVAMLEGAEPGQEVGVGQARDLTVEEVAAETKRAVSTVRGWLISGALAGYKLNGRDWRIPRSALRAYLDRQSETSGPESADAGPVDLGSWRKIRGGAR